GIIGLGLIGGSLAKAIKENTNHKVFGTDLKESVIYKALLLEAIDDRLTEDMLPSCDMTIVALYPEACIEYIKEKASLFKKGSIVFDCCGVKQSVCSQVQDVAEQNNFIFIGGHPMAGLEYWGFKYSQKVLFQNASMILTPPDGIEIEVLEKVKRFWLSLGFTNVEITSPEKHDQIIAFTSQLAHIVSSAYIKSPMAPLHKGFSAGSYKDLTRVAKLNPDMWTELFLMNKDNLVTEIDGLIDRLTEYRDALNDNNENKLWQLLEEGTKKKLTIG
ncbi:MAG: prephenate dehydrogenase, partial [Clostridiales bacterium]|nr:prephenate dehydrogenase [Clostridiales bacterium]